MFINARTFVFDKKINKYICNTDKKHNATSNKDKIFCFASQFVRNVSIYQIKPLNVLNKNL